MPESLHWPVLRTPVTLLAAWRRAMGNTIRGNAIERPRVEPAEVAASMNLFAKEVLPHFRRRHNTRVKRS